MQLSATCHIKSIWSLNKILKPNSLAWTYLLVALVWCNREQEVDDRTAELDSKDRRLRQLSLWSLGTLSFNNRDNSSINCITLAFYLALAVPRALFQR